MNGSLAKLTICGKDYHAVCHNPNYCFIFFISCTLSRHCHPYSTDLVPLRTNTSQLEVWCVLSLYRLLHCETHKTQTTITKIRYWGTFPVNIRNDAIYLCKFHNNFQHIRSDDTYTELRASLNGHKTTVNLIKIALAVIQ